MPVRERWTTTARDLSGALRDLKRLDALLGTWPTRHADRIVSAAYTVVDSDDVILADATGGAFTVTLPTGLDWYGRRITVVRTNSGANAVTVATVAGGNISLGSQYARGEVQYCLTTAPNTFSWVQVG